VSIETKVRGSTQGVSHKGTFKLGGTTLDTGTLTSNVDDFRSGKRNGQLYELIKATER
jgi:hypothetical protein